MRIFYSRVPFRGTAHRAQPVRGDARWRAVAQPTDARERSKRRSAAAVAKLQRLGATP